VLVLWDVGRSNWWLSRRPSWQSYEQGIIMTCPYRVHDDDQDDNNIDDNDDSDNLYAMVFSTVFVFSLCSPSSHMKVD
jgi:hypothetical protein